MASVVSGPSGSSSPAIRIAEQDKAVLQTGTIIDDDDDEHNIATSELGKFDGDLAHGRKQVCPTSILVSIVRRSHLRG